MTTLFHGTSNEFSSFRGSRGEGIGSEPGTVMATTRRADAVEFAAHSRGSDGARVLTVEMDLDNPYEVDVAGELYDPEMMNAHLRAARAGGHDGLIVSGIVNFEGGRKSTTYIAFRAEAVRIVSVEMLAE